jgi:hypothetical protein
MNHEKVATVATQKSGAPSSSSRPPRRFETCTIARLLAYGHAQDKTAYARSIGYDGDRPVVVQDGKVISHRWADWFEFCAACRSRARRRMH